MQRPSITIVSFALAASFANTARAQCHDYALVPALQVSGADPRGVAFGRIDADAYVDLIVPEYASEFVRVMFGTATGDFSVPVAVPGGHRPRAAALGDLDGDGDLDIAVCNEGFQSAGGWQAYGFTVLWNSGGGFPSSTFFALPTGQISPKDIALGDFDGDTDLDVAIVLRGTGLNNSKLASFLNQGGGVFSSASLAVTGYDPIAVTLGDLNGDALLDAVTVNYTSGMMTILNGTSSGTFTTVYGHSAGTYPTNVALGDFDGDGDLDGAISYRYGVHVLLNSAGILTWSASLTAGFFEYGVACADLDGDGDQDLAATDGIGDTLYVWDGDGTGAFALCTSFVVGDNPSEIVPYDVDFDGDLDLGVLVYGDDGVNVLENDCLLGTYCVGKMNSLGCVPAIGSVGTASLSGPDDFHVTAARELSNRLGIVYFGTQPASTPFAGGIMCVHTPVARTPAQNSGGPATPTDCTGSYDFHVQNTWLVSRGWGAGTDLYAQYWSRDPQHPDGSSVSLSNALQFEVQP